MEKERSLKITYYYRDYLDMTGKRDNKDSLEQWFHIISLINTKHYDSINDEVESTVLWLEKRHSKTNGDTK